MFARRSVSLPGLAPPGSVHPIWPRAPPAMQPLLDPTPPAPGLPYVNQVISHGFQPPYIGNPFGSFHLKPICKEPGGNVADNCCIVLYFRSRDKRLSRVVVCCLHFLPSSIFRLNQMKISGDQLFDLHVTWIYDGISFRRAFSPKREFCWSQIS